MLGGTAGWYKNLQLKCMWTRDESRYRSEVKGFTAWSKIDIRSSSSIKL